MASEKEKIKPGDIRVAMEEEEILWMDRKRVTIFALPWSFTKYELTASKLLVTRGFLNQSEEEVRLYRIKDICYHQTLIERMNGTGTLHVVSTDATLPRLELKHIKNARKVKDVLGQAVEVSRRANGVRTSEIIGGGGPLHPGPGGPDDHDSTPENLDAHPALGPDLAPDIDGDGVPDHQA